MTTLGNIKPPCSNWSRKLYVKHDPPYPDNYVDSSFLTQLRRNVNVPVHTLSEMIRESSPIVQQLSSILSFIAIFILILESRIDNYFLIILTNTFTIISYAGWVIFMRSEISTERKQNNSKTEGFIRKRGRETIINGLIFTLLLLLLSPVLKTLTEDTSSDTIWAISSLLFILCWMSHDYSRHIRKGRDIFIHHYFAPFSLNCAMLGSIVLASRLPSFSHVFGFLSLAVNMFAFFPLFRRIVFRLTGPSGDQFTSILLILITLSLWLSVFKPVAFIYLSMVIFISYICPRWLLHLQKYKKYTLFKISFLFISSLHCFCSTIHGPWDEAVINLSNK